MLKFLKKTTNNCLNEKKVLINSETDFNEFERRFKFKRPLKYAWYHYKLYPIFQFQFRREMKTGFWGI